MKNDDSPCLLLARDGIFPVTRDIDGNPLPSPPASGFPFPGTIQGEGKLNGIPSLFVRLAGCNLRCAWEGSACDTPHAAAGATGTRSLPAREVAGIVARNRDNIRHVVITGGEPLLQPDGVEALCHALRRHFPFHVTVESNATRYEERVAGVADLMSLSPKLSSSAPASAAGHHAARLRPDVIQRYISHARERGKDFQLKFVYATGSDVHEIHELLASLRDWTNEDILLMPLGNTPALSRQNAILAAGHAIRNGWRYCDRLHVSLFGDREGV
ncbi:MAG: 7-carboxy-7-deazaguanine synthase QueE [Odoribacteraceae bacterium]|jgi:7-carboxy-7-deazaguanine synthase|nr:7-carboxy-7-deazaguanine synthase QueE [Odoribacteraceae bacterium]